MTNGRWFEALTTAAGTNFSYATDSWSPGWEVAITDFDANGRADVLLYSRSSGQWFQCLNAGVGTFTYGTGFWEPSLTLVATTTRVP